jgi:glutamyl-tRNA(Gln) amidotransferase subunit D
MTPSGATSIKTHEGGVYRGIILPRSETADDRHIVLKIEQRLQRRHRGRDHPDITEHGAGGALQDSRKGIPVRSGKPNVLLLGTGGTIASRLDYRTGAVIPASAPGELYGSVPELADICNLTTEKLFGVFSENMGPEQYIALAKRIGEAIEEGVDGSSSATAPTRCTTPRRC